MKKALVLTILACLLVPGIRANDMDRARERQDRELQEEKERERQEYIARNLVGHPDESAKALNLPPNNLNQLDEARRRYWAAYEKGNPADFLAATTVFSDLLFMRDLVALWTDPTVQDKPLDRFMAMTIHVIPPGDDIPTSAQEYFGKWSIAFHGDIRPPSRGEATNIDSIIDSFNRHFSEYAPYKIARDWAEDIRAPVPLPIDKFVFDLVQRWPMPAPIEQAEKDYEVLLKIFGEDRVFAVAEKVRSAMDQDGAVKDPAALGIDTSLATEDSDRTKVWRARVKHAEEAIANEGSKDYDYPHYTVKDWQNELATAKEMLQLEIRRQNGEHVGYYVHNCYEVFWTLLIKDDPKLKALCQIYRARLKETHSDFSPFIYRTGELSLQSIVDQWQAKPAQVTNAVTSSSQWYTDKNAAISAAMSQHKKILLYITCSDPGRKEACNKMDGIFSQSEFIAAAQNFVLLRLSWDRPYTPEEKAMAKPLEIDLDMSDEFPLWGIYTPDLSGFYFSFRGADSSDQIIGMLARANNMPTLTNAEIAEGKKSASTSTPTPQSAPVPVPTPTPKPTPVRPPVGTPTPATTPVPTPAQTDAQAQLSLLVQEYDKMWEAVYTAQPESARAKLRDEEIKFRESLQPRDRQAKFQMVQERIAYLQGLQVHSEPRRAPTPNPNTARNTIRGNTPEESLQEKALRAEYSKVWMMLPASTRRTLHDAEIDFDMKTTHSDPAVRNGLLKERIDYFKGLLKLESADQAAAVPAETPKAQLTQPFGENPAPVDQRIVKREETVNAPGSRQIDQMQTIITAMANYDWRALEPYFIDGQTNYFGHRHASIQYIINDIINDSRQFGRQNWTVYWDTFKHENDGGITYDSVNAYVIIQEPGVRTHRALERLIIGYTPDPTASHEIIVCSLTLKVLSP